MRPTEIQIEKAVNFWGDLLGKTSFNILSDEECRDPINRDVAWGEIEAKISNPGVSVEDGVVEKFKEELRQILTESHDPYFIFIDVDYEPCSSLRRALNVAGVDYRGSIVFPLKIRMWLYADGTVAVSEGPGAPGRML